MIKTNGIMASDTLHFRRAVDTDCEVVYAMLKEMREGDRRIDEFTITLADFRRDGFGEKRLFDTVVIEVPTTTGDNAVIGFATYFYGYSGEVGKIMYMEDIYVKTEYRGSGFGTHLFKYVGKVGKENDSKRLVWGVFDEPDWNSHAINFYKKLGAVDCNMRELFVPLDEHIA